MRVLSRKIDEFCNPFCEEPPEKLVNLASGRSALPETETYLLGTIKRGQLARQTFEEEWDREPARFLKPLKRMTVTNFSREYDKKKKKGKTPATQNAKRSAESLRDMFIRMIVVVSEQTNFDLGGVLQYPITTYPLSLSHADGAPLKTQKSALLKRLESLQKNLITEVPADAVHIFDGGLLLYTVLSTMNIGASFGSVARTILSTVCKGKGDEVKLNKRQREKASRSL